METVLCKLYHPYSDGLGPHGKKPESLPSFPLEAQAQVSARVRNQAQDNKRRRGHSLPSVHGDHAVFSPKAQPLPDTYHCSARHKDLIWDKKKEHQTHQVGKSAPRPPFLQSHPEQPLRTCRHPHHPYSLVSAFQLRARSWMTRLSYCESTETRLMYQITGISASIYKCQIGNNRPGCILHRKSICWQKNLFCYL